MVGLLLSAASAQANAVPPSASMVPNLAAPITAGQQSNTGPDSGWGDPVSVDPRRGDIRSISCPTAGFCGVLDLSGYFLTRDHGSWRAQGYLPIEADLISCASPTFCAAVAYDGEASFFDGTDWSAGESIGAASTVVDLSCPVRTFCVAVDFDGDALVYDGDSWSTTAVTESLLKSVSCVSETFCVAVQPWDRAWVFDGSTWTESDDVLGNSVADVSCASTTWCVVADGQQVETFDGRAWTEPLTIDEPSFFLQAVSCLGPTFCLAVDDHGRGFAFDGSAWAEDNVDSDALNDVSCSPTARCVAIGSLSGNAVSWADGWRRPRPLDPEQGFPAALSCASRTTCSAVDYFGNTIDLRDGSWRPAQDHSEFWLAGVSCPSVAFCAAVGYYARAYTYRPQGWSEGTQIPTNAVTVSCSSKTFCMAAGSRVSARFDGATWERVRLGSELGVVSISCPSRSFCAAITFDGRVYTYDGSSWSGGRRYFPARSDASISCASAGFCLAVRRTGDYTTFDGSTWSPTQPSGAVSVTDLSCPAEGWCLAVTDRDRAYRYADGGWQPSGGVLDPQGDGFVSVSCWVVGACTAINHAGNALSYDEGTVRHR